MREVVAAINMTVDGFCDHTSSSADEELHQHYSDLLRMSGVILYGRTTFQLMEDYWPALLKSPTGNTQMDEFAAAIDDIPKVVFSGTVQNVEWDTARVAKREIEEEILELKKQEGKDILLGSPSLIVQGTQLNLIDEYQICVHPVIAGKGLPLFKNISDSVNLKLLKTKTLGCGAVVFYYEPTKNDANM